MTLLLIILYSCCNINGQALLEPGWMTISQEVNYLCIKPATQQNSAWPSLHGYVQ